MNVLVKILVSAVVIGIVTEISRRFPTYGGIVAALPLVSLLSIIWLYAQGETTNTLSSFALGVLWGFPSTIVLLVVLYIALKHSFHLFSAIGFGVIGWLMILFIQGQVVKYVKVFFFSQ